MKKSIQIILFMLVIVYFTVPFPIPVFAAQTSSTSISPKQQSVATPLDIYNSLKSNALMMQELNGLDVTKVATSEFDLMLQKASNAVNKPIGATGYKIDNTYVTTTDSTGQVSLKLPRGLYTLSVTPIANVLITGPSTVEIPYAGVPVINIGIEQGNSQVKLSQNIPKSSITTNETLIRVFFDLNGNGIMDPKEPALPWAGVKVSLTKTTIDRQYHFIEGWNSMAFPILPKNVTKASDLIFEILRQGGFATTVAHWHNGMWEQFVLRGDNQYGFDFNLVPGEGYFVRNHLETDMIVFGNEIKGDQILHLTKGYNLVGIRSSQKYTAVSLIDYATKQWNGKPQIKTVTQYDSGLLDPLVKENGEVYGNDFSIDDIKAYFLRLKNNETLQLKD